MSEQSRETGRGRAVPSGLLGMVGLLVAVESFVATRQDSFTTLIPANWRQAGAAATVEAPRCDVLLFGDSQIKLGLLPEVFKQQTGLRAYNLALHGGQAPASYFLLRRALSAGAKPAAIIIGCYPGLQGVDLRINLRQWPELLGLRELAELGWHARDPRLVLVSGLAWAFPSIHLRYEVRATVLAALKGEERPALRFRADAERAWRENAGAQPTPPNASFQDGVGGFGQLMGGRRWSSKKVNTEYMERFLALAAERGIAVFWLMPILSPALQARRAEIGLDDQYAAFVRAMAAKHANLTVIDGRHSRFERAVFIDPVHLDRRGASILSASLAGIVRDCTQSRAAHAGARPAADPRWVELPPFRTLLAQQGLNDLPSTQAAILEQGGTRR